MKGLSQFQKFDIERFNIGKKYVCANCGPLKDKDKNVIGTRIEACIVEDNTAYQTPKDGSKISNVFNKVNVKVLDKTLNVNIGDQIEFVNPAGRVWGDFNNNLSITAKDVKTVNASASKGQN